ncbi:hypothetical protein BDW59DRAFT_179436 [Aspergillus cavernicola]|uniref:Zn(2)-C6 fungal-type domain-containing protein n=1 Tax=Aspergillus cavernicola TaxID=176166 RepID=A0ABR4J118_9EURO
MVGVAGKSKGCTTCRKRKIGCDQQKPVCARCTRSKRVCGGYEKERVFVLVQPAAGPGGKTHTFLTPGPGPAVSLQGIATAITTKNKELELELEPHPFTETSVAYTIMHRRIECHNLVQAFLLNCFPSYHDHHSSSSSSPSSHSWIPLLSSLPTKVEALTISSAAVAASALGHMFHDRTLVKQSLKYYTRGLHQLQRALRDPSLMRDDGTLAACMALSLYEALECPDSGAAGYFSHCRGLIALVQARGSEGHWGGAGLSLFRGVRVPGILFALNHHTPTILSSPTWLNQPWTAAGIPKTPQDRVTDCLAQAPMILTRVRSLPQLNPPQQVELIHELIRECWQIDTQLDVIYTEMRRDALVADVDADAGGGLLYWRVPSSSSSSSSPSSSQPDSDPFYPDHLNHPMFPVVFHFRNPQVAATLLLLWATRTMVRSGLCNLYEYLKEGIAPIEGSSSSSVSEGMGISHSDSDPRNNRCAEYLSPAHRVCQSVEYFLRDKMLLGGVLSVSPALGIVVDSLRNRAGHGHGREIEWLEGALEGVRRRGLSALRYVDL